MILGRQREYQHRILNVMLLPVPGKIIQKGGEFGKFAISVVLLRNATRRTRDPVQRIGGVALRVYDFVVSVGSRNRRCS